MKNKLSKRLELEAEFQNKRTLNSSEGKTELRNRFYFLAYRAMGHYNALTLKLCVGKKVLVTGCSEGGVTPLAKAGAAAVYGIDIANEPIEKLNEAIEKEGLTEVASAFVGNAENIDLPERSIDLICCSGVLHHLDIPNAIASWKKVMTDNGKVVMLEPMAMNPLVFIFRVLTPSMRTADEHPLVPSDIAFLRKHFRSVKVKGYVLTSIFSLVLMFAPRLMKKVCGVLEKLDDALLKVFPFLVYLTWTCTIELSDPIR